MLLTIVVLSLFLLSMGFLSDLAARKSVQKRVETLSEFVSSVEQDLPRQIFIFGFRAIYSIGVEITQTGDYLDMDVNSALNEAFLNGTINGKRQTSLNMTTFYDLQSILRQRASKISANVSLSNPSINITQEDPWNVKITFVTDFYVEDANNLASWNKTFVTDVYIGIGNFTDPVYVVGTQGQTNPAIARTPFTSFNLGNLDDEIDNSYYREYVGAPSFIDRLEGNIVIPLHSEYGIESLVHLINDTQGGVETKSIVDYIYFSSLNPPSCVIAGDPYSLWDVRLDELHREAYGNLSCA